jgi:hypothetical protein
MGIALIQAQTDFRFRIDPESIEWSYKLNTHTDNTYGGKVIQILSVQIETMSIPIVSGSGGRAYMMSVFNFFRDMMIWQRNTGNAGTFSYTPRGYNLKIFASNLKLEDNLQNVIYPVTMTFDVQSDLAGVVKDQIISAEIAHLQQGIGYTENSFNYTAPVTTPQQQQQAGLQANSSGQSTTNSAGAG